MVIITFLLQGRRSSVDLDNPSRRRKEWDVEEELGGRGGGERRQVVVVVDYGEFVFGMEQISRQIWQSIGHICK